MEWRRGSFLLLIMHAVGADAFSRHRLKRLNQGIADAAQILNVLTTTFGSPR